MTRTYELPVSELGPMMREAEQRMKDKSYRASPIGQEVGRYLRAFRWAGNQPESVNQYETVLARFAVRHDDLELAEFASPLGTERALAFLDHYWGDAARDTRAQKLSILKSFFTWAVGERRLAYHPLAHIKGPRRHRSARVAYPRNVIVRLVAGQQNLRDQCCIQLLARMGLRLNELRLLQIKDIDLARDLLTVHGKGGHVDVLPLAFKPVRDDLYLHIQGDERKAAEFLLYPKNAREKSMSKSGVTRWFKRCAELAGLPETLTMHEMRHTAGDDIWRVTGDLVIAQQLLRHEHISTTERYLHPQREDLSRGMRAVDEAWDS